MRNRRNLISFRFPSRRRYQIGVWNLKIRIHSQKLLVQYKISTLLLKEDFGQIFLSGTYICCISKYKFFTVRNQATKMKILELELDSIYEFNLLLDEVVSLLYQVKEIMEKEQR